MMCAYLSFGASDGLGSNAQVFELVVRCECGAMISADGEQKLIDLTRLHLGEFHPDLGANVPGDLILAMAENRKETEPK